MTKCFACDRQIKTTPRILACLDEQTVYVGPCCFAKAENAGLGGYQPPKGGPRLYTLLAKFLLPRRPRSAFSVKRRQNHDNRHR